jgi:hypothetical protein
METRRDFIRKTTMAAGATLLPAAGWPSAAVKKNFSPVSRQVKPLAIAMWDYSWILRHHRYGEFENWDRVLEGLAERGYNAIRMDAMPQYAAADTDGTVETEFRSVKDGWSPSMWGNDYTMSFRPREALLEFLPKCEKYGIRVGLATWFINHGTTRKNIFLEEGGLARAWSETLSFLKKNDLLKNILYVDVLNEYPNWHGYEWFLKEMRNKSDEARKPFYNEFMSGTLRKLKSEFPGLDFFASIDSGMDLANIDLSEFGAMDYHIWFAHRGGIPGLNDVSAKNQTLDYRKTYSDLMLFWKEKRNEYIGWMEGRLGDISGAAAANGIVCGNTEGWGPIFWLDHPELDWGWVKESAEICVDLARRHDNYKFICTSNFTHPQFRGMWEDIRWHRRITSKIKA